MGLSVKVDFKCDTVGCSHSAVIDVDIDDEGRLLLSTYDHNWDIAYRRGERTVTCPPCYKLQSEKLRG